MTIYLALDPGLTTGVAWYDTSQAVFASLEIRGRHKLYTYLANDWNLPYDDLRPACLPDVLVIERWDVRKDTFGKSAQDDPRYIIGHVEGSCYMHEVEYREQRPAEAKRFATNDKLRTLGWYSGGEGHADDAARHLLVALAKDRVPEILEAIT